MSPFQMTRALPEDATHAALLADVSHGLLAVPKTLPPKWLYDAYGSALFERITQLPEYYPTRAEQEILVARAAEIAAVTRARELVELGSGSSYKARRLLAAFPRAACYVPVDVSESALQEAGETLVRAYPQLAVHALVADFTSGLSLPTSADGRLVAFLGGTIGNLLPRQRADFLTMVRAQLLPGDFLLLGVDLVKDPKTLVAAYDDAAQITSAFNKNVLTVVNRELGADFDLARFEHVARWDAEREWMEMRLRSRCAQSVKISALDVEVDFAAGEEMRTEVSAKFRRPGVEAELHAAGLHMVRWWTDPQGRFALCLSTPAPKARVVGERG